MIYTSIHREPTQHGHIIRFELLPTRDMRTDGGPPKFDREALTIDAIAKTARHYAKHPGPVVGRLFHVRGRTFATQSEADAFLKEEDA